MFAAVGLEKMALTSAAGKEETAEEAATTEVGRAIVVSRTIAEAIVGTEEAANETLGGRKTPEAGETVTGQALVPLVAEVFPVLKEAVNMGAAALSGSYIWNRFDHPMNS